MGRLRRIHVLSLAVVWSVFSYRYYHLSLEDWTVRRPIPPSPATSNHNQLLQQQSPSYRILTEYIQQHSQAALLNKSKDRRYAVAYYSCPLQAGNRLHHFMNSILWAIVTNRTVLWQYYTAEICNVVGAGWDGRICESARARNATESECDAVLERAPWMPKYTDWQARLGLPNLMQRTVQEPNHTKIIENSILKLDHWSTRPPPREPTRPKATFPYRMGVEGVDRLQDKVVDFPHMPGTEFDTLFDTMDILLATDEARQRASDLLVFGGDYLYGMLFDRLFAFRPSVQSSLPIIDPNNPHYVTIGIHARHSLPEDDGSRIGHQIACLDAVLAFKKPWQECVIYAMSDRSKTLEALSNQAHTKGCTFYTAETTPSSTVSSYSSEHGQFAGDAYFCDFALVGNHVSDALIGMQGYSTSSALVRERIEYRRRTHYILAGHRKEDYQQHLQCRAAYNSNDVGTG